MNIQTENISFVQMTKEVSSFEGMITRYMDSFKSKATSSAQTMDQNDAAEFNLFLGELMEETKGKIKDYLIEKYECKTQGLTLQVIIF